MSNQISVADKELEDLMAELAAQSNEIVAGLEKKAASVTPAATPEDVRHEALEKEHLGDSEKRTGIYAQGDSPEGYMSLEGKTVTVTISKEIGMAPPWEPTPIPATGNESAASAVVQTAPSDTQGAQSALADSLAPEPALNEIINTELDRLTAEQTNDLANPVVTNTRPDDYDPAEHLSSGVADRLRAALALAKSPTTTPVQSDPVKEVLREAAAAVADQVVIAPKHDPEATQKALTDAGISTQRRVVMNEDGSVKQPALSFANTTVATASPNDDVADVPVQTYEDEFDNIVGTSRSGLKFYVEYRDFDRMTRPNPVDLDNCFLNQSSMYAYFGTLASKAEGQYSRQKALFEQLEAKLYTLHRKLMIEAGEKPTEKSLEMAIRKDPRYIRADALVTEAKEIADSNSKFCNALVHRREMLQLLGNDRRHEQKGALRILEGRESVSDLDSRAAAVGKRAVSHH